MDKIELHSPSSKWLSSPEQLFKDRLCEYFQLSTIPTSRGSAALFLEGPTVLVI